MQNKLEKNSAQKPHTSFYGLILTGGKSTRMQQDKSLLNYHGKTQVEFCYELLQNFCDKIFISNRKEQSELAGHKGLPQIHDDEDYLNIGPLAGILSAMKKYPKALWLVLACDLPYVTSKAIQRLIEHRNPKCLATAYKSVHDGLPEPLCAIYEPKFRLTILKFLKNKIYCPRKIMINSKVKLLDQTDSNALDNINNPEELKNALRILNPKIHPHSEGKPKKIHIQYYATLREDRGIDRETLTTHVRTVGDLYKELERQYKFRLSANVLRVSMNDEFADWNQPLRSGDKIAFIPPVAGG